MEAKGPVCVTGAGGFIASWLVKLLLSRGYKVHGTVRDPSDPKNSHLKKLQEATGNLVIYKADLLDYESLSSATVGCKGVFHTASPVPSGKVPNPESDLIEPAVKGTLNVLKASSEANITRAVYVSSVASVFMNPDWPKDKDMNEECWSDKDFCRRTENFYCLSKTMAEEAAFTYAKENKLDVVTILPSMVIGPLLQSTVNASSLFLIKILKGVNETVENRLQQLVDVRDVADAILLAYEKPEAAGRYICSSHPITMSDLVNKLKSLYPNYKYPNTFTGAPSSLPVKTEKLRALGWRARDLEETLVDAIKCYEEAGFLIES